MQHWVMYTATPYVHTQYLFGFNPLDCSRVGLET